MRIHLMIIILLSSAVVMGGDREREDHIFKSSEIRYNRVEGLFLGVKFPRERWRWYPSPLLYGFAGYGFQSKKWRGQIGIERGFLPEEHRFLIGAEAHDLTDTEDHWIIPTDENSLAAILFREDFHDFFRRVGFSVYLNQNITQHLNLRAEYREDRFESMEGNPNCWALFGGKKKFRENPPVDPGKVREIVGRISIDTRDRSRGLRRGWVIQLMGEFARDSFDSDFNYSRYIFDLRRYQPLGFDEGLSFRLRIGTADAPLPLQKLFDLGGISTLRGYKFKEFTGDRMVLANLEYHFSLDRPWVSGLWIFDEFDLILFLDTGIAWFTSRPSSPVSSFDELNFSKLKTGIGIALTNEDGDVRLNFAKRTDVGGAPLVVTFRINRPF